MATLTPTSPTLNDLLYATLGNDGFLHTTTSQLPLFINLAQGVTPKESITLTGVPGVTQSINTAERVKVERNIVVSRQLPGPNDLLQMQVSDVAVVSASTSEKINISQTLAIHGSDTAGHTEAVTRA